MTVPILLHEIGVGISTHEIAGYTIQFHSQIN